MQTGISHEAQYNTHFACGAMGFLARPVQEVMERDMAKHSLQEGRCSPLLGLLFGPRLWQDVGGISVHSSELDYTEGAARASEPAHLLSKLGLRGSSRHYG